MNNRTWLIHVRDAILAPLVTELDNRQMDWLAESTERLRDYITWKLDVLEEVST